MMSALDDSVGNVTHALHQHGMLNNTIIIFSTDNGGPADGFNFNDASNWPLRCVGVYVVCSAVAMSWLACLNFGHPCVGVDLEICIR